MAYNIYNDIILFIPNISKQSIEYFCRKEFAYGISCECRTAGLNGAVGS